MRHPLRMVLALSSLTALAAGIASASGRIDIAPAFADAPPRCLAVAPFNREAGLPAAGLSAAELVASRLERSGRFRVLEPGAWSWVVARLGRSDFDPTDPRLLARLAEELGVEALVLGSVRAFGYSDDPQVYRDKQPKVAVSLRLVRTTDGATLADADLAETPSGFGGHIALLSLVADRLFGGFADALAEGAPTLENDPPCGFERLHRAAAAQPAVHSSAPASGESAWPTAKPAKLSEAARAMAERLQRGDRVLLRGVTFEYRTLDLVPGAAAELDVVAELLHGYPDLGVAVVAHTDNAGDPAELRSLALRQAEVVKAALLERAVPAWQVTAEGAGGDEPLLPNINRRNRQVNRRVELRLVVPPSGGW